MECKKRITLLNKDQSRSFLLQESPVRCRRTRTKLQDSVIFIRSYVAFIRYLLCNLIPINVKCKGVKAWLLYSFFAGKRHHRSNHLEFSRYKLQWLWNKGARVEEKILSLKKQRNESKRSVGIFRAQNCGTA